MSTVRDDLVTITDAMRPLYERTDSGCLRAEYRLTEGERREFLEKFYELNPHLVGARVADLADMLTDCDAYLHLTESDEYVEYWMQAPPEDQQMVGNLAVIAAVTTGAGLQVPCPAPLRDEWLAKVTEWRER